MVVNVRGTSGSGKTYAVRYVMDQLHARPVRGNKSKKPLYYELDGGVYVIGSYENVCGGCDTISDMDTVMARVEGCASKGSVIFEGLLVTGSYGRWLEVSKRVGGDFVWAFLDTPLDVCIERIMARRQARGDFRPLNPKNTTSKWNSTVSHMNKARLQGERVVKLNHLSADKQLLELVTRGTVDGVKI